jgi:hypothetical protein
VEIENFIVGWSSANGQLRTVTNFLLTAVHPLITVIQHQKFISQPYCCDMNLYIFHKRAIENSLQNCVSTQCLPSKVTIKHYRLG